MPDRKRASLLTLFSIVVIDLIGFGVVIPILPYLAESFACQRYHPGHPPDLLLGHAAGVRTPLGRVVRPRRAGDQ